MEQGDDKDPIDRVWGLAWTVEDITACRKRISSYGIQATEIKKGVKDGTLVMTIKDHTHGVPTLIIEHQA